MHNLRATVPVTITITLYPSTATADVDYNALSGTVTIPAGDHDAISNCAER